MKPTTETIIAYIFRAVGQQFHVDLNMKNVPHPAGSRLAFSDMYAMGIAPKQKQVIQDAIEACLFEFGFRDAAYSSQSDKWFRWICSCEIAINDGSEDGDGTESSVVTADEIQAKVKQCLIKFVEAKKQLYRTQYLLLSAKLREIEDERIEIVDLLASL